MGTKSVKKIKLSKNIINKVTENYIKGLVKDKFSDFSKVSEFYKMMNSYRKNRYFYFSDKKIYYDFETGKVFPTPYKIKKYEEDIFLDFQGRKMTEEEKREIRLKFPELQTRKIYVDCNVKKSGDGSSWESALKTIGEAVEKAGKNTDILVTAGVYTEILILKSDIRIHGGYESGEKIFWRSPKKTDETLIVGGVCIGSANNIVLSNLKMTMGQEENIYTLYIHNSKNIEIYEIEIKDNHFEDEEVCKALYIKSSTVDFYRSEVKNNSVSYAGHSYIYGGAVYLENSDIRFIDSLFKNNSNKAYSTSYQRGGAICLNYGSVKFINCKFVGNSANYGKDVYGKYGNITIYGNSIDAYNISPNYIKYEDIDEDILKKVELSKIPVCELLQNSFGDNNEVFKTLVYNDLIKFGKNKEEDRFLKNNFNFKNGFMIDKIIDGVLNKEVELNIIDTKISKDSVYSSFINGEKCVPSEYLMDIYLNCDNVRSQITPYDKRILQDITRGHWDLWKDNDEGDVEVRLEKEIFARNPVIDVNHNGIVAIDFGTKSTVVVYQKDNDISYIKRIGAGDLEKEVGGKDYENPTVLEFRDLNSFLRDYKLKDGRPETKWETLTTSYTAFNRLLGGSSQDYYSIFSDLKQWAGKGKKVKIKDKTGKSWDLPQFKDLDLEKDINPIEIYAYYIGLGINNMHGDGIFIDYILSFPVKYEKELCEKIRSSFEKGLKKSLPTSILSSDIMDDFKVKIGASEPAAYAVCALQEYGFEPKENENIVYGIFDFGGGTTDFDFGIWRTPKRGSYDYEIEHFYDNGDRYLGGENLLQLLAFEIFKMDKNQEVLKKDKITFILPAECTKYPGSELLINESQEAELNTRKLMEECRYFWENNGEGFLSPDDNSGRYNAGILSISLYSSNGDIKQCELNIDEKRLKEVLINRIDNGVRNFFESWREATNNIEEYEKFHIFLAGNSSKSGLVQESFEKNINRIIEDSKKAGVQFNFENKFEMFPPLGTEASRIKQEERGGSLFEEIVPPTGKTGVAYGLIRSRESGNIKVIKRKSNVVKYFVGIDRKRKFKMIMNRDVEMNSWIELIPSDRKEFEVFFTDIPYATTNDLDIKSANKIKCSIDEVDEDKNIYIRAISHEDIEYTVASEAEIKDSNYSGKIIARKLVG